MLLVVVDQAGIRRRGDDAVVGAAELELARITVQTTAARRSRTDANAAIRSAVSAR